MSGKTLPQVGPGSKGTARRLWRRPPARGVEPPASGFGPAEGAGGSREESLHTWIRILRVWLVTSLACALASFPNSSAFSVQEVEVEGTQALDPHGVAAAAGLAPGKPWASVDPQEVQRRLRWLPRVREAQVEVRWPSRVLIRVRERVPRAVLRLPDGSQVLVDEAGVALERVPQNPGLPVVLSPALPWIRLGEVVPATGVVRLVAEVAALPERELAQLVWARWLPTGDYTVGTRRGLVARVVEGQLAQGLRTAQEVARALRRRGVQVAVVDVRFRGRAVVQPAP